MPIELRLTLSKFVILFLYKDNLLSLGRPLKFFPDIRESRELAIFKSFKSRMPAKTPSGKKPIREFSMSKIVSLVKLRTLGGSLVSQLFLMWSSCKIIDLGYCIWVLHPVGVHFTKEIIILMLKYYQIFPWNHFHEIFLWNCNFTEKNCFSSLWWF